METIIVILWAVGWGDRARNGVYNGYFLSDITHFVRSDILRLHRRVILLVFLAVILYSHNLAQPNITVRKHNITVLQSNSPQANIVKKSLSCDKDFLVTRTIHENFQKVVKRPVYAGLRTFDFLKFINLPKFLPKFYFFQNERG